MLSQPLKLTSSLGTPQTTVKLIRLPEKKSQYLRVASHRKGNENNCCVKMPPDYEQRLCRLSDFVNCLLVGWAHIMCHATCYRKRSTRAMQARTARAKPLAGRTTLQCHSQSRSTSSGLVTARHSLSGVLISARL